MKKKKKKTNGQVDKKLTKHVSANENKLTIQLNPTSNMANDFNVSHAWCVKSMRKGFRVCINVIQNQVV